MRKSEDKHGSGPRAADTSITDQQDCKGGEVVAAAGRVRRSDVDHKAAVGPPASFLTFTEKDVLDK